MRHGAKGMFIFHVFGDVLSSNHQFNGKIHTFEAYIKQNVS